MEQNPCDAEKVKRKIYSKEALLALKNVKLSNMWPECLDKTSVNSCGQWDPVKSFDSTKPTEIRKNSFYENNSFKTNDKDKDNISLRPERRKWNDGCQVSAPKRSVGDEPHASSYRKSYQSNSLGISGGDYDKRSFTRSTISSRTPKQRTETPLKTEKTSKNNSNLDDEQHKEEPRQQTTRNNEPEWFSNGPDNCDEIIELRGISAEDGAVAMFKKDSSQAVPTAAVETLVTSPKREGSRFREIFEKETNRAGESILKAVLTESGSIFESGRLAGTVKPLPNGVLTVEEIERNLAAPTAFPDYHRNTSKNVTVDTLTSFEPSLASLLSNTDVSIGNGSIDNSKVVNWLSNLNKDVTPETPSVPPFYHERQNFPPPQSMYSGQFGPPGLPLMLTPGQQQMMMQQQQQMSLQHNLSPSVHNQHQIAYMKQHSVGAQPNFAQRNSMVMQPDACMPDKYKIMSQHSVPSDLHFEPSVLSGMFLNGNVHPNRHISTDRNGGPPGLPGMTSKTPIASRAILKTPPQFIDFAQLNDHHQQQQQQTGFRRISNSEGFFGLQDGFTKLPAIQSNHFDICQAMRERDSILANQQPPLNIGYENPPKGSSSGNMLANLFSVSSNYLPPLPQAKYADQIETENI